MLDIRRIRDNPSEVKTLLAKKRVPTASVDQVLELDARWRQQLVDLEALKAERNRVSLEIAAKKRQGDDTQLQILQMRAVGEEITQLETSVGPLREQLRQLMLTIPNPPQAEVPDGSDASHNLEVYQHGTIPQFGFRPKPHWEIGEALGILDFERARKISGARFTVLQGAGARLSRVLIHWMLDRAVERGYQEVAPPYLVNAEAMVGTGQFPKFVDDVFRVVPHEYYLIPTAEVPLTNLHREEILEEQSLPRKYTAYTASFRAEAGAAGRDTRGLIRQHQFDKVELVQLVTPGAARTALEEMRRDAEHLLEALALPFRTVLLCGGDMGFGQAMSYDLEVWLPSYERYVEISSVSLMTDFQARRAEIRFRPDGVKKTEYVHTLNGSALAVGRTLAAILENYQTAAGHVTIPEVLRPYWHGESRI